MKTLFPFIAFLFLITSVQAQLSVTLVPVSYHGSHISCNGLSDGSISAVATDGQEPYSYLWSSSATTQSIDNLAAGTYTVTVTDASSASVVSSIELVQPNVLQLSLTAFQYAGGTNISYYNGSDGRIFSSVSGGTTPYAYTWSNSQTTTSILDVTAGSYTLTVTDMNGCTVHDSKTLTQPSAGLQISSLTSPKHNGYEISCSGGKDGEVDVEATGGIAPYQYSMSAASPAQGFDHLPKGNYTVIVTDRNAVTVSGNIQLTEPNKLSFGLQPSVFPNNYNLSAYEAGNGTISAVSVAGGAGSYSYQWQYDNLPPYSLTGQGTNQISQLMSGSYSIGITDGNQCKTDGKIFLDQPSKNAWSLNGDAITSPDENFIGTTNEQDLSLRTNAQERMKIMSNGDIRITNLADTDTIPQVVYVDKNGNLSRSNGNNEIQVGCHSPLASWYQGVSPNDVYRCIGRVGIGTDKPRSSLDVVGNMRIGLTYATNQTNVAPQSGLLVEGKVGIGTFDPKSKLDVVGEMRIGNFYANDPNNLAPASGLTVEGWVGLGTPLPFAQVQIGDRFVIHKETSGERVVGYNMYGNGTQYRLVSGYSSSINFGNNGGIGFKTGGTGISGSQITWNNAMQILDNGNVGIGTTNPNERLQIGDRFVIHNGGSKVLGYNFTYNGNDVRLVADYSSAIYFSGDGSIALRTAPSAAASSQITWTTALKVANDGSVGIGIDPDGETYQSVHYKLLVGGKLGAKEAWVSLGNPWPDYVFKKDYSIKSLDEIEEFISEHHHLPDMPSEDEMNKAGAINLGEMQTKTVKELEELYLQVIKMNDRIKELERKNSRLEDKLNKK
jgi:hypothetical protein